MLVDMVSMELRKQVGAAPSDSTSGSRVIKGAVGGQDRLTDLSRAVERIIDNFRKLRWGISLDNIEALRVRLMKTIEKAESIREVETELTKAYFGIYSNPIQDAAEFRSTIIDGFAEILDLMEDIVMIGAVATQSRDPRTREMALGILISKDQVFSIGDVVICTYYLDIGHKAIDELETRGEMDQLRRILFLACPKQEFKERATRILESRGEPLNFPSAESEKN